MRGTLIYQCTHCGEMVYDDTIRDYTMLEDGSVSYQSDVCIGYGPFRIWHKKCFGEAGKFFANNYSGVCNLVGIKEIKEEEVADGKQ